MIILFLISCLAHKTGLTGVVDSKAIDQCTVELPNETLIVFDANFCKKLKEGDKTTFYLRKE